MVLGCSWSTTALLSARSPTTFYSNMVCAADTSANGSFEILMKRDFT